MDGCVCGRPFFIIIIQSNTVCDGIMENQTYEHILMIKQNIKNTANLLVNDPQYLKLQEKFEICDWICEKVPFLHKQFDLFFEI